MHEVNNTFDVAFQRITALLVVCYEKLAVPVWVLSPKRYQSDLHHQW